MSFTILPNLNLTLFCLYTLYSHQSDEMSTNKRLFTGQQNQAQSTAPEYNKAWGEYYNNTDRLQI